MKSRHKNQPISEDQYANWRADPITQRLFEELELSVIDSFQDYYESQTVDAVAMSTMTRQGAAMMVETVLDWTPIGIKGIENED